MNKETEVNWCICGCGEAIGVDRTWAPGHDLKALCCGFGRLDQRMLDLARVLRKRRRAGENGSRRILAAPPAFSKITIKS